MSIILIYIIIIVILTLSQFPKTSWYYRLNQSLNLQTIHLLCDSQSQDKHLNLMINELYSLCQSYSHLDPLTIESSIKISHRQINSQRLTIPISFNNLINQKSNRLRQFCFDLCQLFNLRDMDERLADYIELCVNQDQLDSSDLIIGFDWLEQKYKVYVDQSQDGLQCLEINKKTGNLRERFYQILSNNNYRAGVFDRNCSRHCLWILKCLGLLPVDASRHHAVIYQVGQQTYHCVLKSPQILRKFQIQELEKYFGFDVNFTANPLNQWYLKSEPNRYRISVISVEFRNQELQSVSLYLRPSHLLVHVTKYHQVIPNLF